MTMAPSKFSGGKYGVGVGFGWEPSSYRARFPADQMYETEAAIHW